MQRGFTLIQISILLTVAALVLVQMLPGYQSTLTANAASTTRMNAVLTKLREYEVSNGTLPCPADATKSLGDANYGVMAGGNGATNNCTGSTPAANYVDATNHIAIGMVPVKTLGLSADYALDGFGRTITYAVDTNATATCWTMPALQGTIAVTDNGLVNKTVAVLISHGADGHGAWIPLPGTSGSAVRLNAGATDTDTLTNAHVNSSFVAASTLTNFVKKLPTSTFDDIVVYANPQWNLNQMPLSVQAATTITPPANGTYSTGQILTFSVTFSGAATVTGTPRLVLTVGANTRYANYFSTSSSLVVFQYTVQSSDSAPYGISVSPTIDMNGGSIAIAATSACNPFFSPPSLVSVLLMPAIYVTDSQGSHAGNNRVQKFDMSGSYISQWGSYGSTAGKFDNAHAIVTDSSGNVYVLDNGNNRVQKFDSNGTYLASIGSSGVTDGKLTNPFSVALDATGNIWVTDSGNHRVQEFNAAGSFLLKFGSNGVGAGQFRTPTGLAIDVGGNVWVSDAVNNNVQEFNSSGTYLSVIGSAGSANGKFSEPMRLAFDAGGNLWVADASNNRIQQFNSSGSWLQSIGGPSPYTCEATPSGSVPACASGAGNGQFTYPTAIAIDSSGNVWTGDHNNRVQKFNSSGSYITKFGSTGATNGLFNYPQGIAFR